MARPSSMQCRSCGLEPAQAAVQYCEECFGPLDVVAERLAVSGTDLRVRIEAGPSSMWRYRDLLPFDEPQGAAAVGWTPLLQAEALGAALGLERLWLKDEGANPTGSFKDRVVAAALGRAQSEGRTVVACSSTGNLARAAASAAARAGLAAVVLVPDSLPVADQSAIAAHGATVVPVAGGYDAANRLAVEASMDDLGADWAWLNIGLRAWYVEGSATVAHEIAEQLGWVRPDHVVVPLASGAMAVTVHRAFTDLVTVDLVADRGPVGLWGAQPAGCAPVADAFARGERDVRPVRADTVAASLAMGDPPDGPEVLVAARDSGGGVLAVAEEDIGGEQRLLQETEGLAVEPAGGVVVGALRRLAAEGLVDARSTVVACLTGAPDGPRAPRDPTAMVTGRVAGTIQPTVSALAAIVDEGLSGPAEEARR